jgi:hypothetical protein
MISNIVKGNLTKGRKNSNKMGERRGRKEEDSR